MTHRRCAVVLLAFLAVIGWAGAARAQFDTPNRSFHNSTAFRLDGKHQTVACESCHLNGQFRGTPNTCYDCHWVRRKDDRYQTRLGTQCEQCHRPTAWTAVNWNHAGQAGQALNADHRQIACESCHRSGNFRASSVVCATCHQKDFAATKSPNHQAAGFPLACEGCHKPSDSTWRSSGGTGVFNHNAIFALVGTHATVSCSACHKNGVYKGTPRECVGCHQADYNGTKNPNHAAAGFPTACDGCHRPTDPSFRGSGATGTFNHTSVFPLVGLHASQACATCHKNNVYRGTSRQCVSCHQENYNRTQNPNHIAAGMSTSCETCHRASDLSWGSGSGFNHSSFPLVGLHASQACAACHKNGVYKGTPRDCVGCHQALYAATKNPPHASSGFSTACETCHKPTDASWSGTGGFNHSSVFPLVGLHATQACAACHINGVYKGTPRTCAGCHQNLYNATKNPPHAASGFSTSCETCHKPTDTLWTQGVFNHSTVYALVGVHATQQCVACHKNGIYKGTSRVCSGCHLSVYNTAANPNHIAAGFPTTCDSCHKPTDATWAQGTFNHTRFPIPHRGHSGCSECHTNPNNFQSFTCTTCHTRSVTDSHHQGRAGYVYDSNACYSCHPNGRAG